MDDSTQPEALGYPVIGCKIWIPRGTKIVASTDPNAPSYSRSTTRAPVVHIEPQPDGQEWVWWSATGSALRAGVWDGDRLALSDEPLPWLLKARKPPVVFRRTCPWCDGEFDTSIVNKKYCTVICGSAARTARAKAGGYYERCPVKGCRGRGYCAKHRLAGYLARALRWGVEYEYIEPRQVFIRDGWVCGLCAQSVDRARKHPDLLCASLDHVLPMSLGGGHLWDNVQCSHLICNIRKGNRI